jgi:hypothetical protein
MTTLCQPCEPLGKLLVKKWSRVSRGFYIKSGRWYCPCDKRTERCSNPGCKAIGLRLGLKVGVSICEHNRQRSTCKQCKGGEVCTHNKRRSICVQCNGSQICEHNRQRSVCKLCKGGSICTHNKRRSRCKECKGGSVCEHSRERSNCKDCNGSNICLHNKLKRTCKICNPQGHIASLRRTRRGNATRSPNSTHTLDDLGMTSKEWYAYLSKTFENRYGRPKTEKDGVHIDEIIPCSAWNIPDDNKYCWHYLNSQWLLAVDNLSKHDSYSQTDKDEMIKRIDIALSKIKTRVSI